MKDVDPRVEFGVLKAQPDVYKGRLVQLAGRIVDIEQEPNGTLLVVRNLPIKNNKPMDSVEESAQPSERFAVLYPGKIDPAGLRFGDEIVVVAQVQGEKSLRPLAGLYERPPYMVASCMHVWKTGGDNISDFPDYVDTYYPLEEKTYCSK